MATSIPAGAEGPPVPQFRKQIADEHGNFVPVPDEPQVRRAAPDGKKFPELKVGDFVKLTGRVLEIQHPQGGLMSVQVGLAEGSPWMQGQHLTPFDPEEEAAKDERIAELEAICKTLSERLEEAQADAEALRRTARTTVAASPSPKETQSVKGTK